MKTILMTTILPLFLASGIVNAEMNELRHQDTVNHMYLGFMGSFLDIDVEVHDFGGVTLDNFLLGLSVGYQFHNNFAFEVRLYGNASDDNFMGTSIKVDRRYSALGKFIFPIDRNFKLYALLGYGDTKVSVGSVSDSDDDVVYGFGLSVNNGNPLQLDVEWVRMFDKSYNVEGITTDLTLGSINLNLVYHF